MFYYVKFIIGTTIHPHVKAENSISHKVVDFERIGELGTIPF